MSTFDALLDDQENGQGPKKPFWALDLDNDDEVLSWLKAEISYLKEENRERHENQKKNLAVYRGIQYQVQDPRSRDEASAENQLKKRSKNPRVIYNHMLDFVEQYVSRMTKYRGAINGEPASEDDSDRQIARVSEELIEGDWDKRDIDALIRKHCRRVRIFGADHIMVTWNRHLGDYDLDWLTAAFKEMGVDGDPRKMNSAEIRRVFLQAGEIPRLPLLDETGQPVTAADGTPLMIDRPVRQGDVDVRLVYDWDYFPNKCANREDWHMSNVREWVDLETLRAQHPDKADKITAGGNSEKYFDASTLEEVSYGNKIEVFHTYHASTEFLDAGRYVKWCNGAILFNKPNRNVGWDNRAIIPVATTVDIDTPAVPQGDSTTTFGRACQAVYNNIMSLNVRSMFLFAHPKWFMPKGAAKVESLGNDTTVVQYTGAVAPVLAQPTLANQGLELNANRAKEDYQQIMGIYGISRGEPPKGVTAAVALTYLDEQEDERANSGVAALMSTLRYVALMELWLMSDEYGKDQRRLVQLLGKTRADEIPDFESSSLRNIGDLKIQNASAFPQQKSARLQYILDLRKEFPGIMKDELAADLLELGETKKFRSIITVAVRKAEQENDQLLNGKKPAAPEPQEYHLTHYRVHMAAMNEPYYSALPPARKDAYIGHVMAHEMELCEAAKKNPMLMEAIQMEFPSFPVFYKDPEPEVLALNEAANPTGGLGMPPPEAGPGGGAPAPQQPGDSIPGNPGAVDKAQAFSRNLQAPETQPTSITTEGAPAPAGVKPGPQDRTKAGIPPA
jgi:hypothetical protein